MIKKITKSLFQRFHNDFPKSFYRLKENEVAIDCGANVGDVTEVLARNGATVYAFEPNPDAYRELCKRFNKQPNVVCINKGVWDRQGTAKLYQHENSGDNPVVWSTGSSLLVDKNNVAKNSYVEVELIDLCEFIKSIKNPVAIIKMDVEGVECEILNKIIDQGLNRRVGLIAVETHEKKNPQLRQPVDELKKRIASLGIRNISLNWR